jgi:hypothetical protein
MGAAAASGGTMGAPAAVFIAGGCEEGTASPWGGSEVSRVICCSLLRGSCIAAAGWAALAAWEDFFGGSAAESVWVTLQMLQRVLGRLAGRWLALHHMATWLPPHL